MMKTLDDYMNDPDIVDEPMALREIHAIRLMTQDMTRDMTFEERKAFYEEAATRFFASTGKPVPYANL